jgi:hypothetical protein
MAFFASSSFRRVSRSENFVLNQPCSIIASTEIYDVEDSMGTSEITVNEYRLVGEKRFLKKITQSSEQGEGGTR